MAKVGWIVVVLVVLGLLATAFATPTLSDYWVNYWNAYMELGPYAVTPPF